MDDGTITLDELVAKLPAGDPIRTWLPATMPADTGMVELLTKLIDAAGKAAEAKNAAAAAGSRIANFPAPTFGTVVTTPDGRRYLTSTYSVIGRVLVDSNVVAGILN